MSAMNFFCKISGALPKAVSISAVAAHGHFNLDPKTQSYRFTSKSKDGPYVISENGISNLENAMRRRCVPRIQWQFGSLH
jgi:hypothetical protein